MTSKPMLSVERELLQTIVSAHPSDRNYRIAKEELHALLDKQSCGACGGCDNGCKLDRESPQAEPAAPHQGEPVTKAKPVAKLHAERLTGRDGEYGVTVEDPEWFNACRLTGGIFNLYAEEPAAVAEVMPFAEKVIAKLQRFEACVSDGQDVDIDRHWFDVLTHLGLLRRVQRSPAYWEITQQGEDALKTTRLNSPQ